MSQTLALNAEEVMILTDRVANGDTGAEPETLSAYPLLLKLGSAYVELLGGGVRSTADVNLACTRQELWLLRSKITHADKTNTDPLFGIKLLTKLYRALLDEDAGVDALPDAGEEGASFGAWEHRALDMYQEKPDAGASTSPHDPAD